MFFTGSQSSPMRLSSNCPQWWLARLYILIHCLPFHVSFCQSSNGATWDHLPNNLLAPQVLVLGSVSGGAQANTWNCLSHSWVSFYMVKVGLTCPPIPGMGTWLRSDQSHYNTFLATVTGSGTIMWPQVRPMTASSWISAGTTEKESLFLLWFLSS